MLEPAERVVRASPTTSRGSPATSAGSRHPRRASSTTSRASRISGSCSSAEDRWGSGLAARLQAAGLEAAAQHGFTSIRLFTPSGHARGRRFYEREGWTLYGEFDDEVFGMPIAEYRRRLGPAGGSTAAG